MITKKDKVVKRSSNKYRTYKEKGKKVKHEPLRDLEGNVIPEANDSNDTDSIFSTKETDSPLTN